MSKECMTYTRANCPNMTILLWHFMLSLRSTTFHSICQQKDLCSTCSKYFEERNAWNVDSNAEKAQKYHTRRKDRAREETEKDKQLAKKDKTVKVSTFDLESVLPTLCTLAGQIFYKHKLATYNFSVYDLANQKGTCYVWNESEAQRGAYEMSTDVCGSYRWCSILMLV